MKVQTLQDVVVACGGTSPASRSEDMERVVAATKGFVPFCYRHHKKYGPLKSDTVSAGRITNRK